MRFVVLTSFTCGSAHFQLSNNWHVVVLSTDHSITSVGYLLYSRDSTGKEVPQIAYLGMLEYY